METKYKPVFGDRVRHKKHGLGLVLGKGVLPNATIVQWYKKWNLEGRANIAKTSELKFVSKSAASGGPYFHRVGNELFPIKRNK